MADIDDLLNDINNTVSSKKQKPKKKKGKEEADVKQEEQVKEVVNEQINNLPQKKEVKEEKKEDVPQVNNDNTEVDGDADQEAEGDNAVDDKKGEEVKKKKVVKKVIVKKGAKGAKGKEDMFLKMAQEQVKLNKLLEEQRKKEAEEELKKMKEEEERIRLEEEEKLKKLAEEEAEKRRLEEERKKLKMTKEQYEEFNKKREQTLKLLANEGTSIDDMLNSITSKQKMNHKKKKQVSKEEQNKEDEKKEEEKKENKKEVSEEKKEVADNKEVDDWEEEMNNDTQIDNKLPEKKEEIEVIDKTDTKEDEKKIEEEKKLRKPIICVLGHVDTGKTKILDKIRRTNVQLGEAGGITQQIGATNFPYENISEYLQDINEKFRLNPPKVPGFLIIDTPGHESFQNLRSRGQSLCDLAVVVIDIMHGLENQTISSLEMLKKKKTPFLIALNKIDKIHEWKSYEWCAFRKSYDLQKEHVKRRFDSMLQNTITQLTKVIGLNTALFDTNENMKEYVNIVPTSAHSGEGIPDLMNMFMYISEKFMYKKLYVSKKIQCSVLEVKVLESVGHTIDVVLVNGTLKVGDKIIVAGINGPIRSVIKYLMTPQPMKELRIKSEYTHHKEIDGAIGLKIFAKDLEGALAGSTFYVYKTETEAIEISEEVDKECDSIIKKFLTKDGKGVMVTSSSLGALEACLEFLNEDDAEGKVPVAAVSLGYVQKKDVIKIMTFHNKEKEKIREIYKEEQVILAFDVHIHKDAQEYADHNGVKIITAEKIYELKSKYSEYRNICFEERKKDRMKEAIFPCSLKIVPKGVFHKYDPVIVGVDVEEGILKVGTPLYCVDKKKLLGVVEGIEKNSKQVNNVLKKDGSVAIRIKTVNSSVSHKSHFDEGDNLISNISRVSIERMKEYFYDELEKNQEYIDLIIKFKKILDIK